MSAKFDHILKKLPYSEPFLFVDRLLSITDEGVTGSYTFPSDSYFYAGHFKEYPLTPGVILTECMAQIGLVCLGIYLRSLDENAANVASSIALSESQVEYLATVHPGETVTVISEKEYFRFGKLKCKVKMLNAEGAVVCRGVLSGMLLKK